MTDVYGKCPHCSAAFTMGHRCKGGQVTDDERREQWMREARQTYNSGELNEVIAAYEAAEDHQAETIAKLPPTGRECCDKATVYWRQAYQAEANENTAIRDALGISAEDSDETLTAKTVTETIARLERQRDEARAELKRLRVAMRKIVYEAKPHAYHDPKALGHQRLRSVETMANRALAGAQDDG